MKKTVYSRPADHSGLLYPLIMSLSEQSNYRFQASLYEQVKPDILLSAYKKTLNRFPSFKVELDVGLFRPSFVENFNEPFIEEYDGIVLGRMDPLRNRQYLLKLSYKDKKIFLEVFHGLADGNGALKFFSYLLDSYVFLDKGTTDPDADYPILDGEDEDAYERYYDRSALRKGMLKNANKNALQIKGKKYILDGKSLMKVTLDTDELLKISKSYNCTLSIFLGAIALLSAVEISDNKNEKRYPALFLPVDLRRAFPSNTVNNFVCTAKCKVRDYKNKELTSYIEQLKEELTKETAKDKLLSEMAFTSTVAKNPIIKYIPLFLKRFFIKLGRELVTASKQTIILSNLGRITLPAGLEKELESITFALNCNGRTPLNMSVASFKGKTFITFTSILKEKLFQARFLQYLKEFGLDFTLGGEFKEK